MRVNVLGAVSVQRDDLALDYGNRKQRALMCALALSPGGALSSDALVDLIWGGDASPAVSGTIISVVGLLFVLLLSVFV